MAVKGFPHLNIYLSNAAPSVPNTPSAYSSGNYVDLSDYITEFSGWEQLRNLIDITGASEDATKYGDSGVTQHPEVTVGGPYDDVAAGLVATTKGIAGATRTLQVCWDDVETSASDKQRVNVIVKRVSRNPRQNELTQYAIILQPIGSISVS